MELKVDLRTDNLNKAYRQVRKNIEEKLFLKVNRKKTEVAHISKVKYIGYTFYRYKGKCKFRVHPKSVAKMKNKIRELTDRNKGISNEVREKKYEKRSIKSMCEAGWNISNLRIRRSFSRKRINGQDVESERFIGNWNIHPCLTIIWQSVKTKEPPCTERYAR